MLPVLDHHNFLIYPTVIKHQQPKLLDLTSTNSLDLMLFLHHAKFEDTDKEQTKLFASILTSIQAKIHNNEI